MQHAPGITKPIHIHACMNALVILPKGFCKYEGHATISNGYINMCVHSVMGAWHAPITLRIALHAWVASESITGGILIHVVMALRNEGWCRSRYGTFSEG